MRLCIWFFPNVDVLNLGEAKAAKATSRITYFKGEQTVAIFGQDIDDGLVSKPDESSLSGESWPRKVKTGDLSQLSR